MTSDYSTILLFTCRKQVYVVIGFCLAAALAVIAWLTVRQHKQAANTAIPGKQ